MATHEGWQFANVGEIGYNSIIKANLGAAYPLSVEFSNHVEGTAPSEEFPSTVVSGDHIRVFYSIPSDLNDFALTGRVKVLKKTKEFPRAIYDPQAVVIINEDYSLNINVLERDEPFLVLDGVDVSDKKIWYYTIFYEGVLNGVETKWAFSPVHGIGRAFALSSGQSAQGLKAFEYMPRGIKILDARSSSSAEGPLFRFLQMLGKPLDEIAERIEQFSDTRVRPDVVDAALIPYIDQILGWPTNYKASEARRRAQTSNAVNVWRRKGANDALEVVLQTLTGWDAELVEGYKYILTTATYSDAIDPNSPPTDWDEQVDGDWAALVGSIPFNGIPDFSTRVDISDSSRRNVRVLADFSENSWVNPYGVLINLIKTDIETALQGHVAIEEIKDILPLLAIHYARFAFALQDQFSDGVDLAVTEQFDEESANLPQDGAVGLSFVDTHTDT